LFKRVLKPSSLDNKIYAFTLAGEKERGERSGNYGEQK
jgi:hypothetical protein